jgi:hypothetical protein
MENNIVTKHNDFVSDFFWKMYRDIAEVLKIYYTVWEQKYLCFS